jgi:endonuclease-3 related protein
VAQKPLTEECATSLLAVFQRLADSLPPDQGWPGGDWPLTGGFEPDWLEVVLGSVLTQNTRWENVENTIPRLRSRGLVTLDEVYRCPLVELEAAIRSAGFFRRKAKSIKRLAGFFLRHGEPNETPRREDLVALKGVGFETADSILLYGFNRPEFVADAYSRRLLRRLGMVGPDVGYADAKLLFESCLKPETYLYKSFHALIVQHAKQICGKSPLCDQCALRQECQTYLTGTPKLNG